MRFVVKAIVTGIIVIAVYVIFVGFDDKKGIVIDKTFCAQEDCPVMGPFWTIYCEYRPGSIKKYDVAPEVYARTKIGDRC